MQIFVEDDNITIKLLKHEARHLMDRIDGFTLFIASRSGMNDTNPDPILAPFCQEIKKLL